MCKDVYISDIEKCISDINKIISIFQKNEFPNESLKQKSRATNFMPIFLNKISNL